MKSITRITMFLLLAVAASLGTWNLLAQSDADSGASEWVEPPAPAVSPAKQAALKTLAAYGFVLDKGMTTLPEFEVALLKGGKAKLSAFKGKLLILNFWATWCPPCRAEMPSMQKTWDKLKAKGLDLLAVSYREKTATVKSYMDKNASLKFPIALDADGKLGDKYIGEGIPTTLLLDQAGRRLATLVGSITWDSAALVAALEVLAGK